jgi:hypothetical protein
MGNTGVTQSKGIAFWEWVPALAFVAVLAGAFLMKEAPIKFVSNNTDAPAISAPAIPSQ